MQTLENELHFITSLPRNKWPKTCFGKLTQLLQSLNENAMQVNDLSTALSYLEQAEHWSTFLEDFFAHVQGLESGCRGPKGGEGGRSSRHGVTPTLRNVSQLTTAAGSMDYLDVLMPKALTTHNFRSLLMRSQQWEEAEKQCLLAVQLDGEVVKCLQGMIAHQEGLENRDELVEGGADSGNTTLLQLKQATIALATSNLQLSSVSSKVNKHSAGLRGARRAIELLQSLQLFSLEGINDPGVSPPLERNQGKKQNRHRQNNSPQGSSQLRNHVGGLLAAAYYNYSSELAFQSVEQEALPSSEGPAQARHLQRKSDGALSKALEYGEMYFPPQHPMFLQITQASELRSKEQGVEVRHSQSSQGARMNQQMPALGKVQTLQQAKTPAKGPVGVGRSFMPLSQAPVLSSQSQSIAQQRQHPKSSPVQHQKPTVSPQQPVLDVTASLASQRSASAQLVPAPPSRSSPQDEISNGLGGATTSSFRRMNQQRTGSKSSFTNPSPLFDLAPASTPSPLTNLQASQHSMHRVAPSSVTPSSLMRGTPEDSSHRHLRHHPIGEKKDKNDPKLLQERYFNWVNSVLVGLYEDYSFRDKAANRIQCAWRCCKARLEAYNRRQVYYHYIHLEQKAATRCVLTTFRRTMLQRAHHRKKIELQEKAEERAKLERKKRDAILTVQRFLNKVTKQRKQREKLMREFELRQEEKLLQYDTAAVLIQRWWPIIKVERNYWCRRHREIEHQKKKQAEASKLTRAATNIQRAWRGCAGRKYAKVYRIQQSEAKCQLQQKLHECTDAIRVFLREYAFRHIRLEKEKLRNEVLQTELNLPQKLTEDEPWAESLEKRGVHLVNVRATQMKDAAMIIQRCFRCFKSRRELRVVRIISRTNDQTRLEKECRQHKAARTMQCMFRCFLARRCRRRILSGYGHRLFRSVCFLQHMGHCYLERKHLAIERELRAALFQEALDQAITQRNYNIILVQSFSRLQLSVVKGVALKEAIEAEEKYIISRMKKERLEEKSAVKIQCCIRKALAKMHVCERKKLVEDEKGLVYQCVVKIQGQWRMWLSRRKVQRRRAEAHQLKTKKIERELVQSELLIMRLQEVELFETTERTRMNEMEGREVGKIGVFSLGLVSAPKSHNINDGRKDEQGDDGEEEGIYD